MANPKSPSRQRDLILIACGVDAGDVVGLSVREAEWVAAVAVAMAQRRPLPIFRVDP